MLLAAVGYAAAGVILLGVLLGLVQFARGIREGYAAAERNIRLRRNLCFGCGYSLRGNVSGVCPECGTAAKTRHADERGP